MIDPIQKPPFRNTLQTETTNDDLQSTNGWWPIIGGRATASCDLHLVSTNCKLLCHCITKQGSFPYLSSSYWNVCLAYWGLSLVYIRYTRKSLRVESTNAPLVYVDSQFDKHFALIGMALIGTLEFDYNLWSRYAGVFSCQIWS